MNELCEQVRCSLEKRENIEKRSEPCTPDDGLYGQLSLLTHLLKHPLRFKNSEEGTRTLEMVSNVNKNKTYNLVLLVLMF